MTIYKITNQSYPWEQPEYFETEEAALAYRDANWSHDNQLSFPFEDETTEEDYEYMKWLAII